MVEDSPIKALNEWSVANTGNKATMPARGSKRQGRVGAKELNQ